MKVNRVSSISFNNAHANIIMEYNPMSEIVLPISAVREKNGRIRLNPGDKFITLENEYGYEFAYLYNWHLYMKFYPHSPASFIENIPGITDGRADKILFKAALAREVWRMGRMPSIFARNNLRMVINRHMQDNNFVY
ncbi:MAG: hypothetical protein IJ560_03990 [Alphaproteobacteria bacterium]|nr:hypothetical protein [Alphaproteobacteria bacterium]